MKKKMIRVLFIFMILAGCVSSTYAQKFYVRVKPAEVVVSRPASPHPGYVWVSGDWTWRSNAYVWTEGHWAAPPRARAEWIPGHWVDERRGSYWIRGHWRY